MVQNVLQRKDCQIIAKMLKIVFSSLVLHMDNIPTWIAVTIACSASLFCAILVQIVVVPWQKKKILNDAKGEVKFSFGESDGEFQN